MNIIQAIRILFDSGISVNRMGTLFWSDFREEALTEGGLTLLFGERKIRLQGNPTQIRIAMTAVLRWNGIGGGPDIPFLALVPGSLARMSTGWVNTFLRVSTAPATLKVTDTEIQSCIEYTSVQVRRGVNSTQALFVSQGILGTLCGFEPEVYRDATRVFKDYYRLRLTPIPAPTSALAPMASLKGKAQKPKMPPEPAHPITAPTPPTPVPAIATTPIHEPTKAESRDSKSKERFAAFIDPIKTQGKEWTSPTTIDALKLRYPSFLSQHMSHGVDIMKFGKIIDLLLSEGLPIDDSERILDLGAYSPYSAQSLEAAWFDFQRMAGSEFSLTLPRMLGNIQARRKELYAKLSGEPTDREVHGHELATLRDKARLRELEKLEEVKVHNSSGGYPPGDDPWDTIDPLQAVPEINPESESTSTPETPQEPTRALPAPLPPIQTGLPKKGGSQTGLPKKGLDR